MLYLSANTTNVIYTSVSVHKTLSNPTYLMSLTHQQTGKRWSFIPQNITNISGSPYNQRYDLFKFNMGESGVNLTGGTNAWYWQTPPSSVYQDSRYSGTGINYLRLQPIVSNLFGTITLYVDFDNENEQLTGGTITLNGESLSNIVVEDSLSPYNNAWNITGTLSTTNGLYDKSGKLEISAQSNSGNTYGGTYYVVSISSIDSMQPWTYYGYADISNITFVNLPITYLETPTVDIDEIGEFRYSIREQINPVNLNPQYTTEILETGLAYVYQAFDDIYYDKGGNDVVYNPSSPETNHILQENGFHILTENNELLTQE